MARKALRNQKEYTNTEFCFTWKKYYLAASGCVRLEFESNSPGSVNKYLRWAELVHGQNCVASRWSSPLQSICFSSKRLTTLAYSAACHSKTTSMNRPLITIRSGITIIAMIVCNELSRRKWSYFDTACSLCIQAQLARVPRDYRAKIRDCECKHFILGWHEVLNTYSVVCARLLTLAKSSRRLLDLLLSSLEKFERYYRLWMALKWICSMSNYYIQSKAFRFNAH